MPSGLVIRAERTGDGRRSTADVHRNFAFQILASQIVDFQLRHGESVAYKREGSFERFGGIDAQANGGILTQHQRFGAAIAHQREARLLFNNLAGMKLDRLHISGNAGRLEAGALELSRHISCRFAITLAARIAAFQFVVGEKNNVRPPALSVGMRIHARRA
jgi:hypothetical protein